MKKSFLSSLLLGVFFVTSIGMLTSCKDYDDDISTNTSAITKLQEQVTTLKSALDQAQKDALLHTLISWQSRNFLLLWPTRKPTRLCRLR